MYGRFEKRNKKGNYNSKSTLIIANEKGES
jgi:hypothetical protein